MVIYLPFLTVFTAIKAPHLKSLFLFYQINLLTQGSSWFFLMCGFDIFIGTFRFWSFTVVKRTKNFKNSNFSGFYERRKKSVRPPKDLLELMLNHPGEGHCVTTWYWTTAPLYKSNNHDSVFGSSLAFGTTLKLQNLKPSLETSNTQFFFYQDDP